MAGAVRTVAALLVAAGFAAPLPAGDAATPPAPTATPATSAAVVLEWSARSEEGVYGYLVYRSLRREGPYRRVSADIIHARHAPPPATSSYRFTDPEVVPGRTYYYYLDTVSQSGLKQRLSGVIAKEVAGAAAH